MAELNYKPDTVVVIGGGAAGFFGAIACAAHNPTLEVILLEKTGKLLSKVLVSGGGRCNVTHHCFSPPVFAKNYPRGAKSLRSAFVLFGAAETVEWFQQRGVALKAEADGRMFPVTDNSQTIVDCLHREAYRLGVSIRTGAGVEALEMQPAGNPGPRFRLRLQKGSDLWAHRVLVSTGGFPKPSSYDWLQALGHTVVPPVPSLFTFNVPNSSLSDLQGIAVPRARVKVVGQKLEEEGPLLVTHWGFSGPVILRLSAWGARQLQERNYHFQILVSWVPDHTEETLRLHLHQWRLEHPRKMVMGNPLFGLPQRLWKKLTFLADIPAEVRWSDLPGKSQNRLIEFLLRCPFEVKGKTTFKEEFVTCGGISLEEVDFKNLQSKVVPGLYFAGEILDVDGITGGFNFQAAWTTGYLAGKAMANPLASAAIKIS